jgi:hypothetical protein
MSGHCLSRRSSVQRCSRSPPVAARRRAGHSPYPPRAPCPPLRRRMSWSSSWGTRRPPTCSEPLRLDTSRRLRAAPRPRRAATRSAIPPCPELRTCTGAECESTRRRAPSQAKPRARRPCTSRTGSLAWRPAACRRSCTAYVATRAQPDASHRASHGPGYQSPPRHALEQESPAIAGLSLMRRRGLEPPRDLHPTRPSTLRVYQFRHRRRWDSRRDPAAGGGRV